MVGGDPRVLPMGDNHRSFGLTCPGIAGLGRARPRGCPLGRRHGNTRRSRLPSAGGLIRLAGQGARGVPDPARP
jgi:hypothetical protein